MITGYLIKHPDATSQYEFDFSADIPTNDFIGTYTLTVVDSAGDPADAVVTASATINTTSITVKFSGGIDGENYRVTLIASLDTSTTTPTKIIELRVRSEDV